jgi:AcrR family transcriptional regulator
MSQLSIGEETQAPPVARMKGSDRRQLILGEAMRIIGEQGYRSFSLPQLSRRCGLTNAGLLHHFGSKDGLLVALLEERDRLDQIAVVAMAPAAGSPSSPQTVLSVLRAIVTRNRDQPELVRLYAVLRNEALMHGHPAHGYFVQREAASIAGFRQMVTDHVADAPATARQISAMMNGLEAQWLRENGTFDLVAEWDKAAVKLIM